MREQASPPSLVWPVGGRMAAVVFAMNLKTRVLGASLLLLGAPVAACDRYYGPGLQAGYQYVSRGSFSLLVSAGIGYAPGMPDGQVHTGGLGGFGLGYTWWR